MKMRIYHVLLCFSFIVSGCTEDTSESFEAENFIRIYDNNTFSESYSPIDMIQTADEGFVILATKVIPDALNSGVYLLKTDKQGKFVSDLALEDNYTNPLAGLSVNGDKILFVCMSNDAQARIVSVDFNLDGASTIELPLSYPSACAFYENELLLLSYDQVDKTTVFSKLSLSGNVTASRTFKIADDDSMEDDILKHFMRTGTRYPFQIGKLSSGYYFNGFSDYTFSLVFTNLSDDDDVDGVVQGQQENGGFSAIIPTEGNSFAVSYFNFGTNYILPKATLAQSGITSINELQGFNMREMVPNATVQILPATVDSKKILIYAANTRSKQIGLFFYDAADGTLLGSKYLGFSNPYEHGRIVVTADGGLAVAGTSYIAGRFPRACLMKISKDEVAKAIQQ